MTERSNLLSYGRGEHTLLNETETKHYLKDILTKTNALNDKTKPAAVEKGAASY